MIFVVGNSRSGTTMLGRILGKNSDVHTFGELHFFEQLVCDEDISADACWGKDELKQLLEILFTRSRAGFFEKVLVGQYADDAQKILDLAQSAHPAAVYENFLIQESLKHAKTIPCEQTPRYLYAAENILTRFPGAYIINLVRDPRDVLLSQKNKWRRRFLGADNIPVHEAVRSWANYHPYTITKLWVSSVREAQRFEQHPRFLSLRFEDFILSPEYHLKKICSFAGLAFEREMLEVPQVGSSSEADRPEQVGIDSTRVSGWQRGGLTNVELSTCQRVAASEMKKLGYQEVFQSSFIVLRWLSMIVFVFKISLAILLNINRSKDLIRSIRRRLSTQKGAI